MLEYILARLKEASTWRGLILVVTAFGLALTPEQAELVTTVGLGLAGLLGTLTADAPR